MTVRRVLATVLGAALAVAPLVAVPSSALVQQVLTWTANDSTTAYASAPATAVAGPTTIVFENSAATGNTTGMPHTLTFDTSTPGYNHDVSLNILANPFDATGGRHEAQVTLTPGRYRYFCAIPGHSTMVGEFTVSSGGEDTTPPEVSAVVSGERDVGGNYVGGATVTVTATDAGSGVGVVEYQLDGGVWTAYTVPVVVNSLGAHMVHYRAIDVAGNSSLERMVSFTVVAPPVQDTTPPEVSAVVSGVRDAGGNYLDSATVTITATDDQSGVDTVEYRVDAGDWTRYTRPVVIGTAGAHTLRYRATDVAGNASGERSVSFSVVDSGSDACPDSDTRATVIIDGGDTGVTNVDTGDGCTINDLIAENAEYPTHAHFVRHVEHVTEALVIDGVLTRRDKGTIVRAAARSDIGY